MIRYYFINGNVETATTELYNFQELTETQISNHLTGLYDVVLANNQFDLIEHIEPPFDLPFYKDSKISEMSALSLEVSKTLVPDYKLNNCVLSKISEEIGETPIYYDWRIKIIDLKAKSLYLRNEFYRLKQLIEVAMTKEQIDSIVSSHKFNDYEA